MKYCLPFLLTCTSLFASQRILVARGYSGCDSLLLSQRVDNNQLLVQESIATDFQRHDVKYLITPLGNESIEQGKLPFLSLSGPAAKLRGHQVYMKLEEKGPHLLVHFLHRFLNEKREVEPPDDFVAKARFLEGDWDSMIHGKRVRLEFTLKGLRTIMESKANYLKSQWEQNWKDKKNPLLREIKISEINVAIRLDYWPIVGDIQNGFIWPNYWSYNIELPLEN